MYFFKLDFTEKLQFIFHLLFFRIREWYSYHFPELVKIVPDNYTFAKCVKVVKNRKELTEEGKYYIIIIMISQEMLKKYPEP